MFILISSWGINSLIVIKCPSLSPASFVLKSILSDVNRATPAFLQLLFTWYIFFHLFTFNLFVSLNLKCVSYRQQICGSDFFIHWTLYLLIALFSSFTFSVVIAIIGGTSAFLLFVFYIFEYFNGWSRV